MNLTRWALLPVVALLLGGCATSQDGASLGNLGRNFADDWAGARAYDRASLALGREQRVPIEQAGAELKARIARGGLGTLSLAATWIGARCQEGSVLEGQASQSASKEERQSLRAEADRRYRAALAFLPSDDKAQRALDPETLNALGYFLAQRGQNSAEAQQAVALTALAVEMAPAGNTWERFARATGPMDSHAWALFRAGDTAKALETQTQVLSLINDAGPLYQKATPDVMAEILYHMGAILRVAGHGQQARDAFRAALAYLGQSPQPSVELRDKVQANLNSQLV